MWNKPIARSILVLAVTSSNALSAQNLVSGKITKFECGDNCYLIITPKHGKDIVGLCVADICAPWNAATKIPKSMIGRRVTVTIGVGKQIDGNGDVVGDFPSFTSVKFQ